MSSKLSEKEIKLIKILKFLPYDLEDKVKENGIIMIILFASERGCIDEITEIASKTTNFDTVIKEVFKNESIEVVDDEKKEQ